jgi:putative transposase
MSPEKKRAMIKRDHPELSISQQCKLVRLSRSAFYYSPFGIDANTLVMMKEIDRVFTRYPFFGSRQIAAYLRREGIVVGRHRVRRLMAKMGLEAIYKRPRTSQPHPQHPVYPYLLRKMQTDRTKSGVPISLLYRCGTGSCIWSRSWTGRRAKS